MTRYGLRGRPPFFPFRRAAAALARLVRPLLASPPKRPSATAAGFLRGIGDFLHAIERRGRGALTAGDVLVAAVPQRERCAAGNSPEALHGVRHWRLAVDEVAARGGLCLHHG